MDHAERVTDGLSGEADEVFSFAEIPTLTKALQRGEEAAYAWLHWEWSARINRYCFAVAAGDDAFATEIAQAVWLRVVRHMRPLKNEQALWNWLACAARHSAIDLHRKNGRYRRALSRFAERWIQPTPAASLSARAGSNGSIGDEDDALLAALDAALQGLDEEERSLMTDRYFSGDSLATMAERRAISVRAVEGRLARLRGRLRKLIAAELNHTFRS